MALVHGFLQFAYPPLPIYHNLEVPKLHCKFCRIFKYDFVILMMIGVRDILYPSDFILPHLPRAHLFGIRQRKTEHPLGQQMLCLKFGCCRFPQAAHRCSASRDTEYRTSVVAEAFIVYSPQDLRASCIKLTGAKNFLRPGQFNLSIHLHSSQNRIRMVATCALVAGPWGLRVVVVVPPMMPCSTHQAMACCA